MRLIVFIYFLTFFLISNVHAKIIFCTSPHVDHTLDIKDNKAIETNPGITILHQSVSYKNNVYILESSPGSGAGKNEKRTWTIDLRKGTEYFP